MTASGDARPDLVLMATELRSASAEVVDTLWRFVLVIAERGERAQSFTIDSTTERRGLPVAASLTRLGPELHPIDSFRDDLATAGPVVLEVNLYAPDGWVAGISDWGDGVAVLFGDASCQAYRREVTRLGLDGATDEAEALDRPPRPTGRGQ